MNKAILQPFRDMERFAANIASGKLDVPLQMDRSNIFGVFTESFDIIREELCYARENERRANQPKKN